MTLCTVSAVLNLVSRRSISPLHLIMFVCRHTFLWLECIGSFISDHLEEWPGIKVDDSPRMPSSRTIYMQFGMVISMLTLTGEQSSATGWLYWGKRRTIGNDLIFCSL